MGKPERLQALAAGVLIDNDIKILPSSIPTHLLEDLRFLVYLKRIREDNNYLKDKIIVLEANLALIKDEEDYYRELSDYYRELSADASVYDQEDLSRIYFNKSLEMRNLKNKIRMELTTTKNILNQREIEEEIHLLKLPHEYENIKFRLVYKAYNIMEDI